MRMFLLGPEHVFSMVFVMDFFAKVCISQEVFKVGRFWDGMIKTVPRFQATRLVEIFSGRADVILIFDARNAKKSARKRWGQQRLSLTRHPPRHQIKTELPRKPEDTASISVRIQHEFSRDQKKKHVQYDHVHISLTEIRITAGFSASSLFFVSMNDRFVPGDTIRCGMFVTW